MTTIEEIKQHLKVQFPSTVGNIPLREGFKQLAAELTALQKEVEELHQRLVKEHLPAEYESWEKVWQRKVEMQNEMNSLRQQNAELQIKYDNAYSGWQSYAERYATAEAACNENVKKIAKLQPELGKLKTDYELVRQQNTELHAEADKCHAKAVELCDKLIEARNQNAELREALKTMLASACPHPMEHGVMYEAWQTAKQALATQPEDHQ